METVTQRSKTILTSLTALLLMASGPSVPSFRSVISRFLDIFSFPQVVPSLRGLNMIQPDVAHIIMAKSAQTVNAALPVDTV